MLFGYRRASQNIVLVSVMLALCFSGHFQAVGLAAKKTDKFTKGLSPELKKNIALAIQNGVDQLLRKQNSDGTWGNIQKNPKVKQRHAHGETILVLYTLMNCGVSANDPKLQKTFKLLRKQEISSTYERGLMLMALHAKWHETRPTKKRGKKSKRKRNNNESAVKAEPCGKMSKDDKAWMAKIVKELLDSQNTAAGWGYGPDKGRGGDHSNTQYALLGLMAAEDCGIMVPESVWLNHLNHFLKTQTASSERVKHVIPTEPSGKKGKSKKSKKKKKQKSAVGHKVVPGYVRGWGYGLSATSYEKSVRGSMTCVGIASLQICRQKLIVLRSKKYNSKLEKEVLQAMEDGLTWLEHNFSVTKNPSREGSGGGWLHYYLYSLERVGMLLNRVYIGEHHWYKEGAEFLTSSKLSTANVQLSFTLLFLKRATGSYQSFVAPVVSAGK